MINSDICCCGRAQVRFAKKIVLPLQAKVNAVTEQYCRLVAHCADIAAFITPLTGGLNGPIETLNEQLTAFEQLKMVMVDALRQRSVLFSTKEKVIIDNVVTQADDRRALS